MSALFETLRANMESCNDPVEPHVLGDCLILADGEDLLFYSEPDTRRIYDLLREHFEGQS